MFLRRHRKQAAGETCEYWTLCESARTAAGPRWERVDARGVRVERARDFGEAFLGLALWRRLGLHSMLADLIEPGGEEVPWGTVASVLAVARFCAQRSERAIAELYRGLDVLAAHQDQLCAHLTECCRSWFGVQFEFLLYDVTSTFFEGQAADNEKAARGYSRDSRPDCQQVCLGGSQDPSQLWRWYIQLTHPPHRQKRPRPAPHLPPENRARLSAG